MNKQTNQDGIPFEFIVEHCKTIQDVKDIAGEFEKWFKDYENTKHNIHR